MNSKEFEHFNSNSNNTTNDNNNEHNNNRSSSKSQEQWNSGLAYVLLHFPLFYALTSESTSMGQNISENNYFYPILFILCMIMSITLYFITQKSNPGFVQNTKNNLIELQIYKNKNKINNSDQHLYKLVNGNQNDNKINNDNNNENIDKSPVNSSGYCSYCEHYKPERSKHCYKCRNCIVKFDHHCPFIGNCIGENNHRWFVLYLLFESITVIWAFAINFECFASDSLINKVNDTWSWWGHLMAGIILFFMDWIALMLFIFHFWLGITNQTTYQMILMNRVDDIRNGIPLKSKDYNNNNNNNSNNNDDYSSSEEEMNKSITLSDSKLNCMSYWKYRGVKGVLHNIYTFSRGKTEQIYRIPVRQENINIHNNNYNNSINTTSSNHNEEDIKDITVNQDVNAIINFSISIDSTNTTVNNTIDIEEEENSTNLNTTNCLPPIPRINR